jgi:uncharacterized protein (UPF0210 family)
MNIRTITYFIDPGWPLNEEALTNAGEFIRTARPAFEDQGYTVQTTRLTTSPFPDLLGSGGIRQAVELADALRRASAEIGFEYVSIGPALPHIPDSFAAIPEILSNMDNVFVSSIMAAPEMGISLGAVKRSAEIIERIAPIEPNGFANLYFAAMANVPPQTPFFPASYHRGGEPTFGLGIESADLAVTAFEGGDSINSARRRLSDMLSANGQGLARVGRQLEQRFGIPFTGVDFSLAPFPEDLKSIGTAMEHMGIPAVGSQGTLTAAAVLAHALDQANFPRAGFNGLFLPVLEDSVLARRAAEGRLRANDLLLYSAVCGCGLDILPLPGETSVEELTPILLDVCALALRLNKPLAARLMPVPGKAAGDPTDFDFPFFANGRVLATQSEPLEGMLAGDEDIELEPRGM